MTIKKRKNAPRETTEASVRSEEHDRTLARNPFLTGLRQDVYMFVQANPNCTRRDVAKGLGLANNVATARIKELIDEGYLLEPLGERKLNPSGVRAKVLCVSDRPAGGKPLDKVRIEVCLTIDCNGVYGVESHVVGGGHQTGKTHRIKSQRITLTAPHPDSYKALTNAENVSTVSRMEIEKYADNIIDADYETLDD